MDKLNYIGGVHASWNLTRKMAGMCLEEVPSDRHSEWFERVAAKMTCSSDEVRNYISGDEQPPESVSFRLFKAAGEVSQEMFWEKMPGS